MKKNGERERKKCMAVKRGVRVRRNSNVCNLAMEYVLKGLPDKIRDQLSIHHTQMHFKDYNIGKNAALRSKNKNWSSQNNVSEWNDISVVSMNYIL